MQKIDWKNLPNKDTPIDADNLNLMQDYIEAAINKIGTVQETKNGNYIKLESGLLIQWGTSSGVENSYREVTFPCPFANKLIVVSAKTTVFTSDYFHEVQVHNIVQENFRAAVRYQSSSGGVWGIGSNAFNWIAIGSWK